MIDHTITVLLPKISVSQFLHVHQDINPGLQAVTCHWAECVCDRGFQYHLCGDAGLVSARFLCLRTEGWPETSIPLPISQERREASVKDREEVYDRRLKLRKTTKEAEEKRYFNQHWDIEKGVRKEVLLPSLHIFRGSHCNPKGLKNPFVCSTWMPSTATVASNTCKAAQHVE